MKFILVEKLEDDGEKKALSLFKEAKSVVEQCFPLISKNIEQINL